jgi:hypothetical protein
MHARTFSWAVVALTVIAFSVGSAGEKGKGGKKGKDKEKTPPVELKFVTGIVTNVDDQKGSFTIAVAGTQRAFAVDESTKFVGPKGGSRGMGKAALKDETMIKGNEVRVGLMTESDKTALEVYLPARGTTPKALPPQAVRPQAAPLEALPPVIEPQFDGGTMRVGPVRRLLRRVFGRS